MSGKGKFLAALLAALACYSTRAQGTINFANLALGLNAPVLTSDRATLVSGAEYQAELLAGSNPTSLASVATTSFRAGPLSGYFNYGAAVVPGVVGGQTAWVQNDIWN